MLRVRRLSWISIAQRTASTALGVQAVRRHGKRVRFHSTVELVNALEQEKAAGRAGQIAHRLTYADMNVAPMLSILLNLPAGKDIVTKYGSLSAYVARLADLPSFKSAAPPPPRR